MVNGSNHFDNGFPLMNHLDIAIDVNDGELALPNYAKVYHVMMMPPKFLAWRELIPHSDYLRIVVRKIGDLRAIPALRGA